MRRFFQSLVENILLLAGFGGVSYGAWLASSPDGWAGWLVGGILLLVGGVAYGFASARQRNFEQYQRKRKE